MAPDVSARNHECQQIGGLPISSRSWLNRGEPTPVIPCGNPKTSSQTVFHTNSKRKIGSIFSGKRTAKNDISQRPVRNALIIPRSVALACKHLRITEETADDKKESDCAQDVQPPARDFPVAPFAHVRWRGSNGRSHVRSPQAATPLVSASARLTALRNDGKRSPMGSRAA